MDKHQDLNLKKKKIKRLNDVDIHILPNSLGVCLDKLISLVYFI